MKIKTFRLISFILVLCFSLNMFSTIANAQSDSNQYIIEEVNPSSYEYRTEVDNSDSEILSVFNISVLNAEDGESIDILRAVIKYFESNKTIEISYKNITADLIVENVNMLAYSCYQLISNEVYCTPGYENFSLNVSPGSEVSYTYTLPYWVTEHLYTLVEFTGNCSGQFFFTQEFTD